MAVAEPGPTRGAASAAEAAAPAPPTRAGRRFSLHTFDALSNGNFRLLLAGNTLQSMSQNMQMLVRGVLAYQQTESFAALGLLGLANSIFGFVFTPLGGVIADRIPKKTVIQSIQLFNAGTAFALAALAWAGVLRFEHLLITTALAGAVNNVMTASRHTIIQDMVGRDKLMNGIALNGSVGNLVQLVGPGVGGVLIANVSAGIAFFVMGMLNVGACLFTVQLPKHPVDFDPSAPAAPAPPRRGGFADLIDGFRYVTHDPVIRTHIMVNFGIVLLASPYSALLPGFVEEVLGRGPTEQGLLVGASGLGALIGGLVLASLPPHHRGRMLLIIATIWAIGLIGFSLSTNYYVTLPLMMLIGAGVSTRLSTGQIILQSYSAEAYRGRTVSVWMTQYSIVSFGTFGVGLLAEQVGPQWAIGGTAALMLCFVALVALFVPRYRNLD